MLKNISKLIMEFIYPTNKPENTNCINKSVKAFKEDPISCFMGYKQDYEWPKAIDADFSLPNIYIRANGKSIGYIHSISVHGESVTVGHFAIDKQVPARTGVGRLVADTFADLLRRYGFVQIIFAENHTDFSNQNYIYFFQAIGAIEDKSFKTRRVWRWQLSKTQSDTAYPVT